MNYMYKISMLLVLQTVLLLKVGVGQAPPNFAPPTPIAREFEKYINYPVDHSTGAAGIDVPLYTLKAGPLEIPVSLSYHTAGVKPGDPSLPVGLGWTISPGARVTRKVMNYPDEMYPKPPYQATLSATTDLLLMENMEYAHPTPNPASNRNTTYDPEYDIFTYYTGTGVTGRFIIEKQGVENVAIPLVVTRDKIKVHTSNNGGHDYIDYVEITDANGVFYRFGIGLTAYSTAGPGNPTTEATIAGFNSTGWMLTDIISADKTDTVSFKWKNVRNDPGNYYKQTGIFDQVEITDQMQGYPGGMPSASFQQATGWHLNPTYPGGQLTETYFLTNIIAGFRYKNIEVKFIYNEPGGTATQLSQMEVYSFTTKLRQIDFHKSLFTNSYLRLDSVSILDRNAQLVSRYRFGYNTTIQLPAAPSRALDLWGYYNGGTSNTSLVPNFPYTVETGGVGVGNQVYTQPFSNSNRVSNMNASAYILNSITYPTGGKTTYEYEENMIYDPLISQAITTGGLRVKKVSHWAVDGQLAEFHSFFYGVNECGYGDGTPMRAEMFANTTKTCYYDGGIIGQVFRKRILMGTPVNDLFLYDFPPATYQQVTEYIGDKTGSNSGKIIYMFTPGDYPLRTFGMSQSPYTYMDRYWNRPRKISTTSFKNNQGTYSPVKRSSTSYFYFEASTITSWLIRRHAYILADNAPLIEADFTTRFPTLGSVFDVTQTYLYCGLTGPSTERNVEYTASGDSIIVESTYGYANNDYLYPATLTTVNSDGTTTINHYKYPKDYNVGSSPTNTVAQGIKLLQDRNVVAPTIEEYTEVQPANIVTSGKFTTFKTDLPLPADIYELKAILSPGSFNPATISSSAHSKSSSYYAKNTINLYDSYGNIRQLTDQVTGITSVLLHSYNGEFPICLIRNATFSSVAAVLGGETAINNFAAGYPAEAGVNSFLSTIRTALPTAFITTYIHDPFFGMTSQTDENGRITSYEYDAYGRLQLIKDKDGFVLKTFEYKYKQ
jgi:YD repeat-containing protein